jgi:hypothetical protein
VREREKQQQESTTKNVVTAVELQAAIEPSSPGCICARARGPVPAATRETGAVLVPRPLARPVSLYLYKHRLSFFLSTFRS